VGRYASILGRFYDLKSCVLEVIPLIPRIVFSSKRWNNSDFDMRAKEMYNKYNQNNAHQPSNKRHFISIINTMIDCGLNYVKVDKASDHFELKPSVDRLSKYSFSNEQFRKLAKFKTTNQWLRQKISHQIVLEVMRRNEAGSHKYRERGAFGDEDGDSDCEMKATNNASMTPFMSGKKNKTFSRFNKTLLTPAGGGGFGAHKPSNEMTQSQSQSNKPTPAKFKNFIAKRNRKQKIEKFEYPVLYKYVEGYTNAVRRKNFMNSWV